MSTTAQPPPLTTAQDYCRRGWCVVPVPYRRKAPVIDEWEKLRLTSADLPQYFNGMPMNVGVQMGEPSDQLVDADLDNSHAVRLAPYFLTRTSAVFGRRSKQRSHWLYNITGLLPDTKKWRDPVKPTDGESVMLLEFRSTGAQTIMPGSTHEETGELIEWASDGEPMPISGADLLAQMDRLAAATLLSRHWPGSGGRQEAALALAGGLERAGWSNEDASEFIGLVAWAAGDEEARKRADTAKHTRRRLDANGRVTGWPRLAQLLGDRVVDKVREWLGIHSSDPEQSSSYNSYSSSPAWPKPLTLPAYHGLAGAVVRKLAPQTEADEAALLVTFLLAFGSIVGRGPHAVVEDTRHGLNENAVFVGPTGKGRKDTARSRIRKVTERVAPIWAADCQGSGLSSGEGLIAAVRDRVEKEERDKRTGELRTVVVDEGVPDKRLLVSESEFASVLKVASREGNTLSDVIRKAWDGQDLRSMTKGSPLRSTAPHISIIGNITADELRRYLTETETANGFANRFLWVCVQRSKALPEGGQPVELGEEIAQLQQVVTWAKTERTFVRNDAARRLWAKVYGPLSAGAPGLSGAVTSRAEAHVLRLSCLYAALDQSEVVREEHLKAALALWRYCEDSARYIFGNALGDWVADRILEGLARAPEGLTKTQLHDLFKRNLSGARLDAALALLVSLGRVTCHQVPSDSGPATEVWRLVTATPSADEKYEEYELDPDDEEDTSFNSYFSSRDEDEEAEY